MIQVQDPVCGATIDSGSAIAQVTHESREYYFCSHDCRRAFLAEPGRWVGDDSEQHEPPFTVTKHMVAPKFGAAGSGGLEHEPGPERHTTH